MNLRPRFSIRSLLVLVTLVGLYFGCWEVTKRWGVGSVAPETRETAHPVTPRPFDSSLAPFVVSRERYYGLPPKYGDFREYHFWFFGFTAKLPFERDIGSQGTEQPPLIEYDVYDVEIDGVEHPIDDY